MNTCIFCFDWCCGVKFMYCIVSNWCMMKACETCKLLFVNWCVWVFKSTNLIHDKLMKLIVTWCKFNTSMCYNWYMVHFSSNWVFWVQNWSFDGGLNSWKIISFRLCLSELAQRWWASLNELRCFLSESDKVSVLVFCESRLASDSSPNEQCLTSRNIQSVEFLVSETLA